VAKKIQQHYQLAYPRNSDKMLLFDSPSRTTMQLKRVGSAQPKDIEGLSLKFKLRSLVVEAHMSDMDGRVIEKNIVTIANELATLYSRGIQSEERCMRFLVLAYERMTQMLEKMHIYEPLRINTTSIWKLAKYEALTRKKEDAETCYNSTAQDISQLWHEMLLAKDTAALLWNDDKLQDALPYLRIADSCFKRLHFKFQKVNIDHAIIHAHSEPVVKKQKIAKVSFATTPVVLGIAQADVDRTPINPSKPTQLESFLLRATREFPMPKL
jgi:hypothetical protein